MIAGAFGRRSFIGSRPSMKRRPFTSRALEARFALLLGRVLGLKEEINRAHRLAESIGIIDGASSKKPTLLIAAEPELYAAWRRGVIKDRASDIWLEEEVARFSRKGQVASDQQVRTSYTNCIYLAEKSLKEI